MATDTNDNSTWYQLDNNCIYCHGEDYTCEYGPRKLLLCSCCPKGTHVECIQQAKGVNLTEEFINSGSDWFCCEVG